MFNKDFYPTPDNLIERMISGLKLDSSSEILEPSAGKGNICDYVNRRYSGYNRTVKIDVIEINEDLRSILKGKNYRVIHDDFLTFQTNKRYDLIIANFPFSNGDEHLLKALQLIQQNGGKLRCLINAETLKNLYSLSRKILFNLLTEIGAEIEYLEDQFLDAERKTKVGTALIKAEVYKEKQNSIILDSMRKSLSVEYDDSDSSSALVERDFIKRILVNFDLEQKAGIKLIEEWFALKPHIQSAIKTDDSFYSSELIKLSVEGGYKTLSSFVNGYIEGLRRKYWRVLIKNPSFSRRYTSKIIKELDEKLTELGQYDFTKFNITELEKELATKISKGIEDAIMKVFDDFSFQYHWHDYSKNIHYFNGWKTNKAHKINQKIILPINGFSAYDTEKKRLDDYYIREKFIDIIKIFDYLAEDQTNVRLLVGNSLDEANSRSDFRAIDFRYFDVTFYKKGTCHIQFKNLELLDKLNIFGSQRKQWLPPFYGKIPYEEMNSEEKRVIDEFQGKDEYKKVMENKEFYLVESKENLQLTSGGN